MPRHKKQGKGTATNQNAQTASLFDGPLSPLAPASPQHAAASDQPAAPASPPALNATALVPAERPSPRERSEPTPLAIEGEPPLPPESKHVRRRYTAFVTAYIKHITAPNPHGLAYRAISPNAAWVTCLQSGGELARQPWVAARIDERMRKIAEKTDVTAAEIVTGLKRIATFDVRRLYKREEGGTVRMREPWELDDITAAAIDQLVVEELPKGRKKVRFKGAGKIPAWELLARVRGMLKEPDRPPIIASININF